MATSLTTVYTHDVLLTCFKFKGGCSLRSKTFLYLTNLAATDLCDGLTFNLQTSKTFKQG